MGTPAPESTFGCRRFVCPPEAITSLRTITSRLDILGAMTAVSTIPARHRSRRRRWPAALRFGWADLLGPAAIASVVAVICLWLMNGGIDEAIAGDRGIGSYGLLTGLLASDLMLLQVFLLARIPWVERAWGHDVLTRRHRWIGFASFWFMVTHVAVFAVERLSRDEGAPLARLWAVFVTDPWMLWATAGTVMIIGVVVTSIRWARRRLRYESWHLLHLYAYLGIGLALPHQLADGADFHDTWSQIYWWTLYITATSSVLVFRIGLPLWRSWFHRLRVETVEEETADVVSVTITGHRLDRLRTRSGQFFIWRFRSGHGWTRGNPYTLSAAPQRDRLRISIQSVGDGSARAAALSPGTRVLIEGPYGALTAGKWYRPRILMIAAGVGVTPMRALLEDTPFNAGDATLVYRYSDRNTAILLDELELLSARRGIQLIELAGPRRTPSSWLPRDPRWGTEDAVSDGDWFRAAVPDLAQCDVFICGPSRWTASVRRALLAAGAHGSAIHTEEFGW